MSDPTEDAKIEMMLSEMVAHPAAVLGGEWDDRTGELVWRARELASAYDKPICWACFEDPDKGADDCMATTRGEINCLL